uniref:AlNc14C242G9500 protein n=1 Tax=Albugo laibachii Nc14 TaxID=890382 RepID=F0WT10_9STRA|nr:AlNc14C242G9500 [Albugo laibachii Nc14]|eukprot:CCA24495.1 AlNc14C242G9500 [Albugo laibachii Nc14]
MYDQCGVLDLRNFRLLKHHHSVVVYRERLEYHAQQRSRMRERIGKASGAPSLAKEIVSKVGATESMRYDCLGEINGPVAQFLAESELPTMIAIGSVPGTLEEAMLGVSLRDTVAFSSIMSTSAKKNLDAQVMATIPDPSKKDRFDYLDVHWYLWYGIGGLCTHLNLRIDGLQMAHSRVIRTSHGERIGVCLLHAIKHPNCSGPSALL